MRRVNKGYWDPNYWPTDYWDSDYWPLYGGIGFLTPVRLNNGYWNKNYWVGSFWDPHYWPQFGSGAPTAVLLSFNKIPGVKVLNVYIGELTIEIKIP